MLYDAHGKRVQVGSSYCRPEPQPEQEERVRLILKSIDGLLDVKWYPYAIWNEAQRSMEGRYALICDWPQNDPRWQLYQNGEIEDHCDMLGWFCTDIQDATSLPVSVDSMEQKILELLGKCDGQRLPHSKRMLQIIEKNAKVRKANRQPAIEAGLEMAETLHHMVRTKKTATVERVIKELTNAKWKEN